MSYEKYSSIEQFRNEFTSQWSPSNDLFLSLDFAYKENGYRMDTGRMYGTEPKMTPDNKEAVFYFYKNREKYGWNDTDEKNPLFTFLSCYASINDALDNFEIDGKKLKELIFDKDFEIVEKS